MGIELLCSLLRFHQRQFEIMRDTPSKFEYYQKVKKWREENKKAKRKKKGFKQSKRCNYQTFLKSDYWKEVRKMVLKRDGHKCRICFRDKRLHIHHETYKHHFNEKNYLDDLITLCWMCHKDWHHNVPDFIKDRMH